MKGSLFNINDREELLGGLKTSKKYCHINFLDTSPVARILDFSAKLKIWEKSGGVRPLQGESAGEKP
jgi:hypothetical protein